MQVEGHRELSLLSLPATGARVSNAYPTSPPPGHSLPKGRLMRGVLGIPHGVFREGAIRRGDGDAFH